MTVAGITCDGFFFMEEFMKSYTDGIRVVAPYTPGEQPKMPNIIKLNTNENPYPPSPNVEKFLKETDYAALRLYPDIVSKELKETLASDYNLKDENVFLGNGSDEVLSIAIQTFYNTDEPILFPDITYSFYDVWCDFYGVKYKKIPLNNEFKIDTEDYKQINGGIIIANPNAPTGIFAPLSEIEKIIEFNPSSIVIIDEAYIDFGGESAVKLLNKYPNLVVVQTYSKSRQLAGIRVGFAFASKELINAMEAVKNCFNSYTVSTLSQNIALVAAKDKEYLKQTSNEIIKTREYTVNELKKIGFETLDSSANFIFTKNKTISAKKIFSYLKDKHIYVRYFDKPRISEFLRITIGTRKQMEILIDVLKNMDLS